MQILICHTDAVLLYFRLKDPQKTTLTESMRICQHLFTNMASISTATCSQNTGIQLFAHGGI